ncbi:MAG: GIN domain-containing protein [Allosphingosinicella sp.]
MRFATLLLAAAALAAPAAAQTPVDLPRFDGIELRGGGDVTVRHGAVQRVTFTEAEAGQAAFDVVRGKLVIRACRKSCRNQRLRVEIVTPRLDAAAITGGGTIRLAAGLPPRDNLALAVTGGGRIDAGPVRAANVAASVKGGGTIQAGTPRALAVSIAGGGSVHYCGDPAKTVSVHGGGTVSKSCSR